MSQERKEPVLLPGDGKHVETTKEPLGAALPDHDALTQAGPLSLKGFSEQPKNEFARYQRLEFLGQGGMARVYKAFDPTLGRYVALKFIRGDDPEFAERLLMEARAQARIEHEHVCKVYEVGQAEGKPYIAMQYIQGKNLKDVMAELSLEQKVKVMQEVSEAVHAAHRVGVIHRDLKPANIMVEQNEDGQWAPYVMDFGLARETDTAGLTMTGAVVGSPWYMSPEQARGDKQNIDRRSDIYSLGTTLYEILSGQLPFSARSGVEILMQLISQEPTPLSRFNETIPRDLETIVMKCLEKEPGRRYDSAKALADDLRCYLEGDVIRARPSTIVYRLSKRVRKNKPVVATVSIAIALVLIFAIIGLRARWNAGRQATIAQEFGQQIKEIEAIMRYGYMLPIHNVEREKRMVRERLQGLQERMNLLGKPALGPGNYAIGQGYLTLFEYEKSRESLERAWNGGYQRPEVAYALGEAYAGLYQEALDKVARVADAEMRSLRTRKIKDDYRTPALTHLQKARAETGKATQAYAEGLLALLDENHDLALKKAQEALAQAPWLFEAKKLEAETYLAKAVKMDNSGDYKSGLALMKKATEAYSAGIEIAASNPALYEGQCLAFVDSDIMRAQYGSYSEDDFRRTISVCDLALKTNPESQKAVRCKSEAMWNYGDSQYAHGRDPMPYYRQAIDFGRRALQLNSKDVEGYVVLGEGYRMMADYQIVQGVDPTEALENSLEILKKGMQVRSNDPVLFNKMGNTYNIIAQYKFSQGKDPSTVLESAVASFQKAVEIANLWVAYSNLGLSWHTQAEYEMMHGRDPIPSLNRSIEAFRTGLRLHPDHPLFQNNLGYVLRRKAAFELEQGMDPQSDVQASIAALQKSIEVDPKGALAYGNLAIVYNVQSAWQVTKGMDPATTLNLARSALSKTMELNRYLYGHPDFPQACAVDLIAARWAIRQGGDPVQFLQQMKEALKASIAMNPQNASAYFSMADTLRTEAEWRISNRESANREIEQALENVIKALQVNPEMAEAMALEGNLLLLRTKTRGGNSSSISQAVALLEKALERNPHLEHQYGPVLQQAHSLSKSSPR